MTPEVKTQCFGTLPAIALREAHARRAEPLVPSKTRNKVVAYASRASVSPQAALEALFEFVLVELSRRAVAERHIQIRNYLLHNRLGSEDETDKPPM